MGTGISEVYARAGRAVLGRRKVGFLLLLGGPMHAAGHAGLAAAAGALVARLAGSGVPGGLGAAALSATSARLGSTPLVAIAGLGVIAAIVKAVGTTASSWAEATLAGEVGARLRMEVLEGWLARHGLHAPRHADHGSPRAHAPVDGKRALAALTSHVHEVERGVSHGALVEARAALALAPLVGLLFVVGPDLALGAALALAGFAATALVARARLRRAGRESARHAEATIALADEAVRHAELFTAYDAVHGLRSHVDTAGRAAIESGARARALTGGLASTSEIAGAVALFVVLALASRGFFGRAGDLASLAPFAVTFFMAYKPLRELTEARAARARAEAALEALAAVLAERGDGEAFSGSAPRRRVEAAPRTLEVDAARARHGRHAPLSLTVAPGEIVAIVGPTGVGKSSLLRALVGVEVLEEGDARYDGASLRDLPAGLAARPFAWLPQDAPLLAAPIEDNVWLGAAPPSPDATREVLARVGASRLARELVGTGRRLGLERAVSGGERQWISLARAVASGAPVLLLDEPSSSLDEEAEATLLEAIERLRGARTILFVTHRATAAARADRVVTLSEVAARDDDADRRPEGDLDAPAREHLAVEHPRSGLVTLEGEAKRARQRVDAVAE